MGTVRANRNRRHSNDGAPPSDITLRILREAAASEGPIGAGTIYYKLVAEGVVVGVATVGRRLREMESDGLLRKEGVKGRSLTVAGRREMVAMADEQDLEAAGRRVLSTMRIQTRRDLVLILEARRPIEREVARLAALRATPEDLLALENAVLAQDTELAAGGSGVRQDIHFHEQLARASHNPFLHALVSLLRHHRRFSAAITSARRQSGSELGVEHHRLLDSVKRHDADQAEAEMDSHLRHLMAEVEATSDHT